MSLFGPGAGKLFVPYLTAGLPTPGEFVRLVADMAEFADAIEIGIPFSDPVMDGPVIQESSQRAIDAGVTVDISLSLIAEAKREVDKSIVVMTYYNLVHRRGVDRFLDAVAASGGSGLIVPDLPFEESGELRSLADDRDLALIQMVAPTTSAARLERVAGASRGWVYVVSRLGVTGERESLADESAALVEKVKPHASVPVLVGIGISSGEQARKAAGFADGVIVGSALVRRVLEGDLEGAVLLAREIRKELS